MSSIYKTILCLSICGTLTWFSGILYGNQKSPKGTLIILNGPSSAGKSSIQKEFQKISSEPYLAAGIDDFHVMLPENYIGPDTPEGKGINVTITEDEKGRMLAIQFGESAQKVIKGMHLSLAALASAGNDVIVDYILYDSDWLPDLVEALKNHHVYFVGVRCSLEELERRERARSKSDPEREGIVGHARSHYATVHANMIYDLEINTEFSTSNECARMIRAYIEEHPQPQALQAMIKPKALEPQIETVKN
jgi:chloramphenicol 3-O phosphotransferase